MLRPKSFAALRYDIACHRFRGARIVRSVSEAACSLHVTSCRVWYCQVSDNCSHFDDELRWSIEQSW